MPYIDSGDRENALICPRNVGELNYAVTSVINSWLSGAKVNYHNLNAAIGVLECAKLELYRRIAAPYEDVKMLDNGDVYTCK